MQEARKGMTDFERFKVKCAKQKRAKAREGNWRKDGLR